jgi:hypothetical protein
LASCDSKPTWSPDCSEKACKAVARDWGSIVMFVGVLGGVAMPWEIDVIDAATVAATIDARRTLALEKRLIM